ncbi:PEP-CTERM sorting domain-containing protein [Roseiconus lacunae]|uniref:PEP-CTERM sorting domain-containing protein n=2 Tax=Roseiconus lacunae TaxID=2605694 RepID=A0ABT7PE06_9BACT|nr:PEP-CTERM sorting domain-containing protein [Roseiconus lacunae]MDM4014573.1 PEP-CTERM sorting domain-containing protein [Roseiconus lacunae]WRQ49891.1 PEP-CTERM sorting domain-containing protein [Stieleria sp. HD01]
MSVMRKTFVFVACLAAMSAWSVSAVAAPLTAASSSDPRFGWDFGEAGSINAEWDSFTTPVGAPGNLPDVAHFGSGANSVLTGNTPGAFIVSSGNIYSFSGTPDFTATIDTSDLAGDYTRVVAQIVTQGTAMDLSSVLLDGIAPTIAGFGGSAAGYMAIWDLATSGGPATSYSLDFNATGPHLSLDQLQVDAFSQSVAFATPAAVPEPAAMASLAALGVFGVFSGRRRRS